MIRLLLKAFHHNWSAQASNKANLWAALTTMIVNNILFLYGMWLMLFDGKPQNKVLFPYYLTLTMLAYVGWGAVNFFLGGLRVLGETIDNGRLEPMLGTPRSPLLLAAISESSATALGDLIQGGVTLVLLFTLSDVGWVLRAALCSVLVIAAFASIFIAAGSLTFFMNRGAALSTFLIESTLSFTMYPMTKIIEGPSRFFLYLIPAALTATLPMSWIEEAGWPQFLSALFAILLFFCFGVWLFHRGLRNYRAANYVSSR